MFRSLLALVAAAFLSACGADVASLSGGSSYHPEAPAHDTSPPTDSSVAYQANAAHTGYLRGRLHPPLTVAWAAELGNTNGAVGYPVVANGIVVVAANGKLVALDATTGKIRWTHKAYTKTSGGAWVGPAYDGGKIFSDPIDTDFGKRNLGMYAFDERSGKLIWSASAPREWAFSSPPTAISGSVYTVAAGDGGEVYAYSESSGALDWSASPLGGDDSSPAVTPHGLYVAFSCPQVYDYNPGTGKQIWHYNGSCSGGGGSTPVYYDGLLFVEDAYLGSQFSGAIFEAAKGKVAGYFNSDFTPAIANYTGYFVGGYGSTLQAARIPSMRPVWMATLSADKYVTPPLVVGDTVYIETAGGELFGYDAKTGEQEIAVTLGSSAYTAAHPSASATDPTSYSCPTARNLSRSKAVDSYSLGKKTVAVGTVADLNRKKLIGWPGVEPTPGDSSGSRPLPKSVIPSDFSAAPFPEHPVRYRPLPTCP